MFPQLPWLVCLEKLLSFFFVKHQDQGELNVSLWVHKNMCTAQPAKAEIYFYLDMPDGIFPKFRFISHGHLRKSPYKTFRKSDAIFKRKTDKQKLQLPRKVNVLQSESLMLV